MIARLARSIASGVVATTAMSLVIVGGKEAGFLVEPPPKQISARAARKVGLPPRKAPETFQAAWIGAHYGYGTAFALVNDILWRRWVSKSPAFAVLYGVLLWAVSYFGIMPMMGLLPPPHRDSLRRQGVMVVAHLVYSFALWTAAALWGDNRETKISP